MGSLPAGEEKRRTVRTMFDRISVRYDLVNRVMTFGMDLGWRRRAVRELRLPAGSVVLDLACGTGDLCTELLRNGYRTLGIDFAHGMLMRATTDSPLVEADVLQLPLADGVADGATCGFALRNVVDLNAFFAEAARVVRSGGRVAFLETARPEHRLLRAGHAAYMDHVVPALGAVLSDRDAYRYLPSSMAYLPSSDELLELIRSAGFVDARRIALSGGVTQLLVATRS